MNFSILPAIGAVALALAAVPAQAQSTETKTYHPSDCQVFGATAWTDLSFTGHGVKNLAASPRNIICPLIMDQQSAWDGTTSAGAGLRTTVETAGAAASVTCTVYVTATDTATVNSYAMNYGPIPANTKQSKWVGGGGSPMVAASGSHWENKAYMLCTLGPGVRLSGYYLYEKALTD